MRVHSFDDGFEAAAAAAGNQAGERELLPDGEHRATIREASEGPHRFPENPGEFLHLTIAPNGSYGLVWVSIGRTEKDRALAASLLVALAMTPDEWADADVSELVGRELRIRTRQGTKGKPRVFVNEFLPLEPRAEKPAGKPAKPQTQAAKVAAAKGEEAGGGDDIPFAWMLPFVLAVMAAGGMA